MKTKRKTSQAAKMRRRYASNQQRIQTALGLSIQQYNDLVFETGCQFLEERFPLNTGWREYYHLHAESAAFWQWWRAEWSKWEYDLLDYAQSNYLPVTVKLWKEEMIVMVHDGYVDSSFHNNYIKTLSTCIRRKKGNSPTKPSCASVRHA